MKKNEVKIGGRYVAKVSDKLVTVRIDSTHRGGGWHATNTATGKRIRIKSAQRLRGEASKKAKEKKPVDPDRCATPRCKGEPAVTHLGKPLCQKCWDRVCQAKEGGAAAAKTKPKSDKKAKARKVDGEKKEKRVSAIDAAAEVLKAEGKPMRAKEMIEMMAAKGLWSSPNGKTPHATLYSAILREVAAKGDAARFRKVERGQFAFNG